MSCGKINPSIAHINLAEEVIRKAYSATGGLHPQTSEVLGVFDEQSWPGDFKASVLKVILGVARRHGEGRWLRGIEEMRVDEGETEEPKMLGIQATDKSLNNLDNQEQAELCSRHLYDPILRKNNAEPLNTEATVGHEHLANPEYQQPNHYYQSANLPFDTVETQEGTVSVKEEQKELEEALIREQEELYQKRVRRAEVGYAFYRVRLLSKSVFVWKTRSNLHKRLKEFAERSRQRHLSISMTAWKSHHYSIELERHNENIAESHYKKSLLANSLFAISYFIQKQKNLKAVGLIIQDNKSRRLLCDHFYAYLEETKRMVSIRNQRCNLESSVKHSLLTDALSHWRQLTREKQFQKAALNFSRRKSLQSWFSNWKLQSDTGKQFRLEEGLASEAADDHYRNRLVQKSLMTLSVHAEHQKRLLFNIYASVLISKCFDSWKAISNKNNRIRLGNAFEGLLANRTHRKRLRCAEQSIIHNFKKRFLNSWRFEVASNRLAESNESLAENHFRMMSLRKIFDWLRVRTNERMLTERRIEREKDLKERSLLIRAIRGLALNVEYNREEREREEAGDIIYQRNQLKKGILSLAMWSRVSSERKKWVSLAVDEVKNVSKFIWLSRWKGVLRAKSTMRHLIMVVEQSTKLLVLRQLADVEERDERAVIQGQNNIIVSKLRLVFKSWTKIIADKKKGEIVQKNAIQASYLRILKVWNEQAQYSIELTNLEKDIETKRIQNLKVSIFNEWLRINKVTRQQKAKIFQFKMLRTGRLLKFWSRYTLIRKRGEELKAIISERQNFRTTQTCIEVWKKQLERVKRADQIGRQIERRQIAKWWSLWIEEQKSQSVWKVNEWRTRRILSCWLDWVKKTREAKEKAQEIGAIIESSSNKRFVQNHWSAWKSVARNNMSTYKCVSILRKSIESRLVSIISQTCKDSFVRIKEQARAARITAKKLEKFKQNRRTAKIETAFEKLKLFYSSSIRRKKGLQVLARLLWTKRIKQNVWTDIAKWIEKKRDFADCFTRLHRVFEKNQLYMGWAGMLEEDNRLSYLEDSCKSIQTKRNLELINKGFRAWKLVLSRKNAVDLKGEEVQKHSDLNLSRRVLQLWMSKTFVDESSYHNRSAKLKSYLEHHKAVEHKRKKDRVAMALSSIDWIFRDNYSRWFLINCLDYVEHRDAVEYHVERIERIFKKITLREWSQETQRTSLLEQIQIEYKERLDGLQLKKVVSAWRRVTTASRTIAPKIKSRSDYALKKQMLSLMYEKVFTDPSSLHNRALKVKELVLKRQQVRLIRRMIAVSRWQKSLRIEKNLGCKGLYLKIAKGCQNKQMMVLRILRLRSNYRTCLAQLNKIVERKLIEQPWPYFQTINYERSLLEKKVTRLIEQKNIVRKRQLFAEIKSIWTRVKGLEQLGRVFSKMHVQLQSKGILNNWSKYTLLTESSLFQKSIKAREAYRRSLKKKSVATLKQLSNSSKREASIKNRAEEKYRLRRLRCAWRGLFKEWTENSERRRWETLNRCFKGWHSYYVKEKEDRELDQMMRDEDEQSRGDEQSRVRNERFMMLLMGGNYRDRPGEGTEFTSEGGNTSYEDKAIKSMF